MSTERQLLGFPGPCQTKWNKKKKKFNINLSVSTSKHIALLSPGIDDSSYISQHTNFSMSVTPQKIPPQKTQLPMPRMIPKTDHEVSASLHRGYDSHHESSNSTVSDQYHDKKRTEHIEYYEVSSSDVVQQYGDNRKRLSNTFSI